MKENSSICVSSILFSGYLAIPNCRDDRCLGLLIEGDSDTVRFQMRTALHTGVLFFVHGGAGIYILAYMQNNSLVFEFKDGVTRTQIRYADPEPISTLCSGEWHNIIFNKVWSLCVLGVCVVCGVWCVVCHSLCECVWVHACLHACVCVRDSYETS